MGVQKCQKIVLIPKKQKCMGDVGEVSEKAGKRDERDERSKTKARRRGKSLVGKKLTT